MPELGDVRRKAYNWQTYAPCDACGVGRWTPSKTSDRYEPRHGSCGSCAKKDRRSNAWKGGRVGSVGKVRVNSVGRMGYFAVWLEPDDPFYPMVMKKGYCLEHRYIMAQHLGRCLTRSEVVHHKNGDRGDNRIENLELYSRREHEVITLLESRVKYLEQRVTLLEAENIMLNGRLDCYVPNP